MRRLLAPSPRMLGVSFSWTGGIQITPMKQPTKHCQTAEHPQKSSEYTNRPTLCFVPSRLNNPMAETNSVCWACRFLILVILVNLGHPGQSWLAVGLHVRGGHSDKTSKHKNPQARQSNSVNTADAPSKTQPILQWQWPHPFLYSSKAG